MESIVTSKTKLYSVIGDPISHSQSPDIHNRIFRELKTDRLYISLRIPPRELGNSIEFFRNNLQGFNITIPHKEAIIPFLDELDERARIYGAVNTVKIVEGKLKGYNTDGYGFMRSLEDFNLELKDKRTLILGAGGAARVIAYELALKGCRVTIANRNLEKAKELKLDLELNTGSSIDIVKLTEVTEAYELIINTTPVGMIATADEMPIDEEVIKNAEVVYDIIYNPNPTKLLRTAEKYECKTINGFSMLFYQAVKAQEIWLDDYINKDITTLVLKELTT